MRNIYLAKFFWSALLIVWVVLLSGIVYQSRGILQLIQLKKVLNQHLQHQQELKAELVLLEKKINYLKSNKQVQKEEIYRILGYVSENDLIVEFKE